MDDRATDTSPKIRGLARGEADACEEILRELPEWFGIESFIQQYRRAVESMKTYVAATDEPARVHGFATVLRHDEQLAEVYVMAVRRNAHRRGIGRALLGRALADLREDGFKAVEVKTIGPSHPRPAYRATRAFYRSMGFEDVEETSLVWGEQAPCLIMRLTLGEPAETDQSPKVADIDSAPSD